MRKMLFVGAAAVWSVAAHAEFTREQDAAAFGVRESIVAADLSPDGRKVVYIEPAGGTASIAFVADVETGAAKPFLKSSGARKKNCGGAASSPTAA